MRRLIIANFVFAILWTITGLKGPEWIFASMALILAFIVLVVFNFASIFDHWRDHRFRSFYPIATFVVAIFLSFWSVRFISAWMRHGTPESPETFLTTERKAELGKVAKEALDQSFIVITSGSSSEASMASGHPQRAAPPDILMILRKYGFYELEVDPSESLVTFSHQHGRARYRYIFSAREISPLQSRPPKIADSNIGDWTELIRIAKQGERATEKEAESIVFTPDIAFSYLQKNLGEAEMDKLKGYNSGEDIAPAERKLVFDALNQQWPVSSHLIEDPLIYYDDADKRLYIGRTNMHGFWVVSLIMNLLADGVLTHAADGKHLKARGNLTPAEENRVAWAQIGLMNFVYGNLFHKGEHFSDMALGDGWYFSH